jgi:hypothetical protein
MPFPHSALDKEHISAQLCHGTRCLERLSGTEPPKPGLIVAASWPSWLSWRCGRSIGHGTWLGGPPCSGGARPQSGIGPGGR